MSTIVTILKFLPEIVAFIKMLRELIESGKSVLEVRAYMKGLDSAVKKANETKDTSEIENLFNGNGDQP